MERKKIIIDTDIGDDIDDALAVAFALNSPELELIGITTVFRNTDARAKIAANLLQLAKRDVPVYAGCRQPILNREDDLQIPCQYSKDMDEFTYNKEIHAVDYIINTVMESDGDITLVPIGPLTNIGMAILKCPELKTKLKGIVLMGGCFYFHHNEWNIYCDPEAAKIVFESGIPIKAIGLDVTLKCRLSENDLDIIDKSESPVTKFLSQLIRRWRDTSKSLPILHDPLAVCSVFNDNILEMQNEKILVETRGEYTRGTTFNKTGTDWSANSRTVDSHIKVAKNVNADAFIKLFIERITRLNEG
ncbi:MAG TPA: nucleoside hydrolase [Clostridiaceae bacterium]|jgi:purine nucleosidase|nr:nucleoside hydrolase [Clostridiaceae bacterium]